MPPSYRLPTAQSLGRKRDGGKRKWEDWREGKNGSTRIRQTELVPREKSDRSKHLTGTIDFFFSFHSSVFSLPLPLLKARQFERPPEMLGSLYLSSIIPLFLFPPLLILAGLFCFFFISLAISYNSCPTIRFSSPETSLLVISRFPPSHRRDVIAHALSAFPLSDCYRWRFVALFLSSFLSLLTMTGVFVLNMQREVYCCRWQVIIWSWGIEVPRRCFEKRSLLVHSRTSRKLLTLPT